MRGHFSATLLCVIFNDQVCILDSDIIYISTEKKWIFLLFFRYRLEHIRKSIEQDKELALLKEDDKIYKNFVYCIRKHEDALQLVFSELHDTVYKNLRFTR